MATKVLGAELGVELHHGGRRDEVLQSMGIFQVVDTKYGHDFFEFTSATGDAVAPPVEEDPAF